MEVMDIEDARKLCAHVVEMKLRWGKQYTADDVGYDNVLRALVAIAQVDNERISGQDEIRTKLNRQLGAAKSREKKLRATVADLRVDLADIRGDLTSTRDELAAIVAEGA